MQRQFEIFTNVAHLKSRLCYFSLLSRFMCLSGNFINWWSGALEFMMLNVTFLCNLLLSHVDAIIWQIVLALDLVFVLELVLMHFLMPLLNQRGSGLGWDIRFTLQECLHKYQVSWVWCLPSLLASPGKRQFYLIKWLEVPICIVLPGCFSI